MHSSQPGNGHAQFSLASEDIGSCVRIYLATGHPPPELGKYLAREMAEWFRQHTHLRLISVVGINRSGETVELQGWYEQVRFPDSSGVKPIA